MSIIYSLLVFFLCLSLHECNARLLGVVNKEPKDKFHLSNKNEEDKENLVKASVPLKEKQSWLKKHEVAKKDSMLKEIRVDKEIDQKPLTPKEYGKKLKAKRVKISGATVQTESLGFVSWRLPHKKRGEQQPGFNLDDYSPPKTHPPVNN